MVSFLMVFFLFKCQKGLNSEPIFKSNNGILIQFFNESSVAITTYKIKELN